MNKQVLIFSFIIIVCLGFWGCTDGHGQETGDTYKFAENPTVTEFTLFSFGWGEGEDETYEDIGTGKVYEDIEKAPVCDICGKKHHVVFEVEELLVLQPASYTTHYFNEFPPEELKYYQPHFYCLDCIKKAFVQLMNKLKENQ